MWADALRVVGRITEVLESLGVRYVVGGSLASSMYGVPRATQDVDLAADLDAEHLEPLLAALAGEFYVSPEAAADAIRTRTSFNVIHLATMFKADIFVADASPWAAMQLQRGREEVFESTRVRFASPEDVVLHKLGWFRLGNEISDRQWSDVLGVLRTQAGQLDEAYIDRWAEALGVRELLERARREAPLPPPPRLP